MDFGALKIGCDVIVTLNNSNRLFGEFNGYKEGHRAIILKNVRFCQEEAESSANSCEKSETVCGELSVDCKHIIKLDVLEEDTPMQGTSLVQYEQSNEVKETVLPLIRSNRFEMPCTNWLPGTMPIRFLYRTDVQKQMQRSMQDYCKKFFESINFAQLISPIKVTSNILGDLSVPRYLARFYREPVIPTSSQLQPFIQNQSQDLVSFHQESTEIAPVIQMQIENAVGNAPENNDACAMIISELLNNPEDNNVPIISVHQLGYDLDKLNIDERVDMEIAEPHLPSLLQYQLPPFLKYSNGILCLNKTFYSTIRETVQENATENNETLYAEDPNNFAMDFQAIEE